MLAPAWEGPTGMIDLFGPPFEVQPGPKPNPRMSFSKRTQFKPDPSSLNPVPELLLPRPWGWAW